MLTPSLMVVTMIDLVKLDLTLPRVATPRALAAYALAFDSGKAAGR